MEQIQPGNRLWNKLVGFLENFDSVQMRYAGHEWRKLVDYVEQMARVVGTVRLQRWHSGCCSDHDDALGLSDTCRLMSRTVVVRLSFATLPVPTTTH
jgi:hypothetical protein